jgi:3-dehydroquinate synthase
MKFLSSEIRIKRGLITAHPEQIVPFLKSLGSKCALITDEALLSLYAYPLKEALQQHGCACTLFSFPGKEPYKTRATKERLEDELFSCGFGRDSVLVALGGGVVSDVVGFVASTYCRGVPYVIIPTTLLAMCDASIGGKTGVNVPYGKNMVGTIYQPKCVYIDQTFLDSLPPGEMKNGMAEILKHAIIADEGLFSFLERHQEELFCNSDLLEKAITESVRIKKEIVEEDEREEKKRAFLNFGHTVGHALEKLSGYTMAHGEAVAIGMKVESEMAYARGALNKEALARIVHLITAFGLPIAPPFAVSKEELYSAMKGDKKSKAGIIRFVLIDAIGRAKECVQIDL